MAQSQSSDILMKFILNGRAIKGESNTILDVGTGRNELLTGFQQEQMFELESFTFSVSKDDDDSETAKATANATSNRPGAQRAAGRSAAGDLATTTRRPQQATRTPLGGFKAWRTNRKQKPYPVNIAPITFTRAIDRASTALMQHCIDCTSFDYVALVKRKPAGGAAAGEPYLRMDFTGVLIIDVAWTNDDPIKETCKFISRAVTVRYRPQLPSGKLGAPRVGFWSMLPWETEAPLR